MSTPDVFHAGFAKCGSTFLQSYFTQHDQVFMVFKSESISPMRGEWDAERASRKYSELFADKEPGQVAVESDEHLIMPIFHPVLGIRAVTIDSYREVLRRLSQIAPNEKLILVIRNPTDMIVSTYSQYVLSGGTLDINDFTKELLNCSLDSQNYLGVYYHKLIEIAREYFDDRILTLLLEDMRSDLDSQLNRINDFLGIPAIDFKDSFKGRRIGLSSGSMRMFRLVNRVLARNKCGAVTCDFWIPFRAYKLLCNVVRVLDHYVVGRFMKDDKLAMLSSEVRELIVRTFASDTRLLAETLSRDLDSLGYSTKEVPLDRRRTAVSASSSIEFEMQGGN